MRKQHGFSLIELLIVVAIILVIAAIAIPNLLRSRMAANEASAVGSLRAINNAEVTYNTTYNNYICTLAALGPPSGGGSPSSTGASIIDANLASGTKSGYRSQPGTCNVTWKASPPAISGWRTPVLREPAAAGTSAPTIVSTSKSIPIARPTA